MSERRTEPVKRRMNATYCKDCGHSKSWHNAGQGCYRRTDSNYRAFSLEFMCPCITTPKDIEAQNA